MKTKFEVLDKCKCQCHYSPKVMHVMPCCSRTYFQYEKVTQDMIDLYKLIFPNGHEE